jgi:hypothetical protein
MKTKLMLILALTGLTAVYAGREIVYERQSVDAFYRLPVADPTTIFDSTFQYDQQSLLWEPTTNATSTVTHMPNESSIKMDVTSTNDIVALQTRQYHRYQPGKSQNIYMTFSFGAAQAGTVKRVGYFDAQNGIFLEQATNGIINIVKRSYVSGQVVETRVPQSQWNTDKLTGNVPSYVTMDWTKALILVIDLQWLGVGNVRVGFAGGPYRDGLWWAHEFQHAGLQSTTYMTTASLPLRYELSSTGSAGTMRAICSAVVSSGGVEEGRGYLFSAANVLDVAATTSPVCSIAIRPKQTFNGVVNRTTLIPLDVELLGGANPIYYELRYGDTLTSASWVSADANSVTEYSTNAVVSVAGRLIEAGFVPASGGVTRNVTTKGVDTRLPLVLDSTGSNAIPMTVIVRTTTGNANTRSSIGWREMR